jgi:hypothetical protein
MINNFFKKISILLIFFSLASCATSEKNYLVTANGKYGQTWVDGIIWMEITFKSAQECLNNVNYELNNNPQARRQMLVDKSLSLVCAEKPFTREKFKFDSVGLVSATGGLTYEGFLRLATSNEKYAAWFLGKELCEVISSDLKMQNKNQDIVCP